MKPLFELGEIVATPGALEAMKDCNTDPVVLLSRHLYGDWGTLCQEDVLENEFAITHGNRILSSYTIGTLVRVWIITEADRSSTTILLPSEY